MSLTRFGSSTSTMVIWRGRTPKFLVFGIWKRKRCPRILIIRIRLGFYWKRAIISRALPIEAQAYSYNQNPRAPFSLPNSENEKFRRPAAPDNHCTCAGPKSGKTHALGTTVLGKYRRRSPDRRSENPRYRIQMLSSASRVLRCSVKPFELFRDIVRKQQTQCH